MRVRVAVLLLLPLLAAACFEDPVRETLVIQMVPEGKAVVTADVKIAVIGPDAEPTPFTARIAQLDRDYLTAQDAWSRRFDRVFVEHDERTITRGRETDAKDHRKGELSVSRVRHMAVISRDDLPFLLGEAGVTLTTQQAAGRGELLLVPGGGSLSTAEQRRVLRKHLDAWAELAVVYLVQTRALYAYLDGSPDRATAVFAGVLKDLLDDETREANPLLDDEKELVERVHESMNDMAEELSGMEDLPYGLNELAYLVYDPLPAALTVCLPREAERVEGFVPAGSLCYAVPRRGIIEAFNALDGRWLAPDPFVTWIRIHRSEGEEKLDLAAFVAKPRSVRELPDASAIVKLLEAGMRHEPAYRLEWIEPEPERLSTSRANP